MGRIMTSVALSDIENKNRIKIHALVDTGASHLFLPLAWKEKLGEIEEIRTVELETATQETEQGRVCGPVRAQIAGFEPIFTEIIFIKMEPNSGEYEPLLGYIPLEQSQAAVDMSGHRLVHVKRLDLKGALERRYPR